MRLGIVGSEAAKFTDDTRELAIEAIENLITKHQPSYVISGGCHLGGIDIWAKAACENTGIIFIEHLPKSRSWSGGYKERNLAIARDSDMVVCITVKELPPDYKGMCFKSCYHCDTDTHVKSGGCWTVKQAIKMGKEGRVIVIE